MFLVAPRKQNMSEGISKILISLPNPSFLLKTSSSKEDDILQAKMTKIILKDERTIKQRSMKFAKFKKRG